jgi:hypothetical protein
LTWRVKRCPVVLFSVFITTPCDVSLRQYTYWHRSKYFSFYCSLSLYLRNTSKKRQGKIKILSNIGRICPNDNQLPGPLSLFFLENYL